MDTEYMTQHGTAQLVYKVLGNRLSKIDVVMDKYEEVGLEDDNSYATLEDHRSRLCLARGWLQENTEKELEDEYSILTDDDPAYNVLED